MATPTPTIDELLKKIRESTEEAIKKGEEIAKSAQASLQQLTKLSEDLKKLAEELRKPPATTAPKR
jgi:hypothetical protein